MWVRAAKQGIKCVWPRLNPRRGNIIGKVLMGKVVLRYMETCIIILYKLYHHESQIKSDYWLSSNLTLPFATSIWFAYDVVWLHRIIPIIVWLKISHFICSYNYIHGCHNLPKKIPLNFWTLVNVCVISSAINE